MQEFYNTMEKETFASSSSHSSLMFNAASFNPEDFRRRTPGNGELAVKKFDFDNVELSLQLDFEDRNAVFDSIKTCGKEKDRVGGNRIHARLLERGILDKDIALNNSLLCMYAKCGAFARAREMFEDLPTRTVVSWNALIAAHVLHGLHHEALTLFDCMQDEGLSPNAVTFMSILKACGSLRAADKGTKMHAKIDEQGWLQNNIALGTAVVDMYAKCGELSKAEAVLDDMPARNVAGWTALMTGCVEHGFSDMALSCFYRMQDEGLSSDAVNFMCALKACGNIGALRIGREIHKQIDRQGLLAKDIGVGNALLDMYVKCGAPAEAEEVFNKLAQRDTITWTTLISGFADLELGEKALDYFRQMQTEGHIPNEVTFVCALKACGGVCTIDLGETIRKQAEKQGFLYKHINISTALMDMYFKCGVLAKAQEVFDKLSERNLVTWNVLISGYVQHELNDEALQYYGEMLAEGFAPDSVTFVCILKACGNMGIVEKGIELHSKLRDPSGVKQDAVLGTALVDMYAKCGVLETAQKVFDEVEERGVSLWNALISGYAQAGKAKAAFDKFITMSKEGFQPSVVTFVVLLTMCSHEGLVEDGVRYFDNMTSVYNVVPTSEHRSCLVDIYARAGQFHKALSIFENASLSDCLLLWSALMGSFIKDLDLKLGRWALENALQLQGNSVLIWAAKHHASGVDNAVSSKFSTLKHDYFQQYS